MKESIALAITNSAIEFPVKPQAFMVSVMNLTQVNITNQTASNCAVVTIKNPKNIVKELSAGIQRIINTSNGLGRTSWISIDKENDIFAYKDGNLRPHFSICLQGHEMQMFECMDSWLICGNAIPHYQTPNSDIVKWKKECEQIKSDFKKAVMITYKLNEKEFNFAVKKHIDITEVNRESIILSVKKHNENAPLASSPPKLTIVQTTTF